MGVVYRAHDTRLDREVALKFLPADYASDPQALARFHREARTLSALNHPHICTVHDIAELDGRPFLVMEIIHGTTLRAVGRAKLPLDTLLGFAAQAARGLAAAHAAGIVHRDVKPENIMVRDDGYVKVLDFGLARPLPASLAQATLEEPALTSPGTILGSTHYMSPEQARGESLASHTDVFSLGIVLYELVTGRHPFAADSQLAVLHAIMTAFPAPASRFNPEVTAPLAALLERMLSKDPARRPGAAEVAAALAELSRVAAGSAPAPPIEHAARHTVGRTRERAALRAALDSADAGRGLVVCVTGEPGMGKTTLVEDFLGGLTAAPRYFVAGGRCSERLAGAEAYLPFLEALDGLLQGVGGDQVARILKALAPVWYVQLVPLSQEDPALARVLADARTTSQERLKRELNSFLQELTRIRPLVLFLEDLHWADPSTTDLLAYVGGKCAALRLLVVLTYRPSDLVLAKHSFRQIQRELQAHGLCREVALEFLSPKDVDNYLALEFPEHRFPKEFASLIYAKTEGNPLFMVDLLRYLRDSRVIAEDAGRWALAQAVPEVERDLPASVRSLIQRTIDQLDDADRRLLGAASVQGNEFNASVAARVLERDAAEVEERLEELASAHGLVRRLREQEFPDGTLTLRYAFVHVLYQNALYTALTPARRVALSKAVAEALMDHYKEQTEPLASELALLFEAARDFERATDYFLRASQNSARLYANQEAVTLAGWAIASAEKLPGPARPLRVLAAATHLARLHQTLSQYEDAVANFHLAEQAAREAGNVGTQVEAICGQAMALFDLKQMPGARAHGQRALELAQAAGLPVGVASAEAALACERLCTGALAAAEAYFDRAIPVLLEQGPPVNTLEAISFRCLLHAWRLEYDDAERACAWATEKARELAAGVRLIENLFHIGMARGNRGRMGEALQTLQEAARLAELTGDRYHVCRLPNTLGWLHRELQDLETALRLDADSARVAQEVGSQEAEANAHVNLAHDHLALGEPARALEHLRRAEQLFDQDVWFRWRYNIRLQAEFASYWIVGGDLKMARSHAAASLRLADTALARKHMAWAHKLLGDIAALEGRVEDARGEYAAALLLLEAYRCPTVEWKVLEAAADLAGRLDDAAARDQLSGRRRAVLQSLADSLPGGPLRQSFLASPAFRGS
jgi:hypothetical protein